MKKWIRDILIISGITIVMLEMALRIIGYQAYHFPSFSIVSEPVGALIPHEEMGLALQPGDFVVTMNDSLEYLSTRTTDSVRLTGNISNDKEIALFGCSFTYGMGVDTDEAFPYLLQTKLADEYKIVNYAVPGHGNIQGWLALQKIIKKKGQKPSIVMMFYAAFHDQRNVMSPYYREHLHYGFMNMDDDVKERFKNSISYFPYAELKDEKLHIEYVKSNQLFSPFPLREYSAIMNTFQNVKNQSWHKKLKEREVSKAILLEMNQLCMENDIEFIVASITRDDVTQQMLNDIRKDSVKILDMGLDIANNVAYNNHPYDSHPNAKAHQIYAERIFQYLNPMNIH